MVKVDQRALFNAMRVTDEMIMCKCEMFCDACIARQDQLVPFFNAFFTELLGDLHEHPERLCEFNNLVTVAHQSGHNAQGGSHE